MERLVLASQSPRRKQLLDWAEIDFEVIVPQLEEIYPPDMHYKEVPVFLARKKADQVSEKIGDKRTVVAADTIVVLGDSIIGKPVDKADAMRILSRLSGQMHLVITGVVIQKGTKRIDFSQTTEVWFHELTPGQIEFYIDKYRPYDKAGAYAIQEWIGVVGIKAIRGDFYNVMGLPVSQLLRELQKWPIS